MTPEQLFQLLRKPGRFTLEDLRDLAEGLSGASAAFAHTENAVWLNSRLSAETISSLIELDQSIRKLDEGSSSLVNTTNKLTKYILALTIAAVFVGVVQLIVGILQLRH